MIDISFSLKTGSTFLTNPTPQDIFQAVENLTPGSSATDYFILQKHGAAFEGPKMSFLQTCLQNGPYNWGMAIVEYRDGKQARQYRAHTDTGQALIDLFLSYLNNDDAWLKMVLWRDATFRFPDLYPFHPETEFAKGFFPEGEWDKLMQEKKQHENSFFESLGD